MSTAAGNSVAEAQNLQGTWCKHSVYLGSLRLCKDRIETSLAPTSYPAGMVSKDRLHLCTDRLGTADRSVDRVESRLPWTDIQQSICTAAVPSSIPNIGRILAAAPRTPASPHLLRYCRLLLHSERRCRQYGLSHVRYICHYPGPTTPTGTYQLDRAHRIEWNHSDRSKTPLFPAAKLLWLLTLTCCGCADRPYKESTRKVCVPSSGSIRLM